MICFKNQIVPANGECAICFETDRKLKSFDCVNCLEGAWLICDKCKEKIEKSNASWGNKCPVCREPKKKRNTVIVPIEIVQSAPEIITLSNQENRKRCCCLKLPSENDYYLRENPGNYICIDCGYITNTLCTFMGIIALGFVIGFYTCQKNEEVLCPVCLIISVSSSVFLVTIIIILLSGSEGYFKRDPIRKDKIKLLISVIGTLIYTTAIGNSEGCSINWYGYLSSIILFPIIYNLSHCVLNCFV